MGERVDGRIKEYERYEEKELKVKIDYLDWKFKLSLNF